MTAKQSERKEGLGGDSHPKAVSGLALRPQAGAEPLGSATRLRLAAGCWRAFPRL